jgi:hypothetical protein
MKEFLGRFGDLLKALVGDPVQHPLKQEGSNMGSLFVE